jgi:hypothetical protein
LSQPELHSKTLISKKENLKMFAFVGYGLKSVGCEEHILSID